MTFKVNKFNNSNKILPLLQLIFIFFKNHPPEDLDENLPCIKELEFIFKNVKRLSDLVFESDLK